MELNGNEVVVFVFVADGKAVTSFVPAQEAPPNADYDDVYNREDAVEYIVDKVLDAGSEDPMEKIEEFEKVIEEIDVGETPEDI